MRPLLSAPDLPAGDLPSVLPENLHLSTFLLQTQLLQHGGRLWPTGVCSGCDLRSSGSDLCGSGLCSPGSGSGSDVRSSCLRSAGSGHLCGSGSGPVRSGSDLCGSRLRSSGSGDLRGPGSGPLRSGSDLCGSCLRSSGSGSGQVLRRSGCGEVLRCRLQARLR